MRRGVLLVAHGSHLSPTASPPAYAHRERLRRCQRFDEVRVAFWKEEPGLWRGLEACQADDITIVPLLMSEGYFVRQVIPRELGLSGRLSTIGGRHVRYAAPVGSHPALARAVLARAREAGAGRQAAIVVLGHGTTRNRTSARNIHRQAELVAELEPRREVRAAFLEESPTLPEVLASLRSEEAAVVPFFVADGWHVGTTVPEELAGGGGDGRGRATVKLAPAVGTHPLVAEVIAKTVEEAWRW